MNSACPKCGIIEKSGRLSCCGRGGSWFDNCGSVASIGPDYTWYEGVRACKARQFQTAVDQQQHAYHPNIHAFSGDASMGLNSKVVFVAPHAFRSTPVNTSTPLLGAASISVPPNTSIIAPVRKLTSKAIGTTPPWFIHTPVLAPNPTTPRANEPIFPQANWTIIKSMPSGLTDMSIPTYQASASSSITAREYEKLMPVIIQISMKVIIFCWC